MGYALGIDVGTTFTAAALFRDGNVEVFPLATYQVAVPSVIFADGDELLFAGAAERAAPAQPLGLAREFKRRLGDPVPLDAVRVAVPRRPADGPDGEVGRRLRDRRRSAAPPTQIVMTHPANWTEYQLGTLRNALADVGLSAAPS